MSILFSPVGTADPSTLLGDGPMLHIVRKIQPERIVLLLSSDMARHQQEDGRYTKAIEWAARVDGFEAPEVRLAESKCREVYRFDSYIEEFEDLLNEIASAYPDEKLLVNVSSGTPAMEQALVALGSFGRLRLEMLQVLTPRRGTNRRDDREDPEEFVLDIMLELSNEAEADRGFESRIIEVESPNFCDRVLRENIASLVSKYEYAAAYELASRTTLIRDSAKEMILAAADRLHLDSRLAAKVFSKSELAVRTDDLLAEYLYVMEVRLEQGQWADFLRSMTPAFTEAMRRVLGRSGLDESKYLKREDNRNTRKSEYAGRYDPELIRKDPRLSRVFRLEGDRPRYMTNELYAKLVEEYCDEDIIEKVKKLRIMESRSRNPLSHEVQVSTREKLEKLGGMRLEEVLGSLVFLYNACAASSGGQLSLGLYRRISERIVQSL